MFEKVIEKLREEIDTLKNGEIVDIWIGRGIGFSNISLHEVYKYSSIIIVFYFYFLGKKVDCRIVRNIAF